MLNNHSNFTSKNKMLREHNDIEFNKKAEAISVSPFLCIQFMVLCGSSLQGYVHATFDAIIVSYLFFIIGLVLIKFFFPSKQFELRAFLLTYGFCVFVGGLSQYYSINVFSIAQSTSDAIHFFSMVSQHPPFVSMSDILKTVNAPLAVFIWQQVYKLTWFLGFDFAPYTAILLNSFVMGITASITVGTARELFRGDSERLKRVGTLFAFCGMFWLFGTILIRDCFTTLFNTLIIFFSVRWFVRLNIRNFLTSIFVIGLSLYALAYLRFENIIFFGIIFLFTIFFWVVNGKLNLLRFFFILLILLFLLIYGNNLMTFIDYAKGIQKNKISGYTELSAASSEDSLGMRLVVNKPLPIRVVMGSGSLMIFPIPLWATLKSGAKEYDLIKAYHGIYQVLIIPFAISGIIMVIRKFIKGQQKMIPFLFITSYLILGITSVSITTLETRHVAQFLPSLLILAAFPNLKNKKVLKNVEIIGIVWLTVVFLIHLAWLFAKI